MSDEAEGDMMTVAVAGPMFENAKSGYWGSVHGKDGGHYNNFGCRDEDGMAALREMFPDGEANEMNFVLFSTSGVHGMYTTIEEAEVDFSGDGDGGPEWTPSVTFLIVQPRVCTLRHGNCEPSSVEDFAFLRRLRESSWQAVHKIGQSGSG